MSLTEKIDAVNATLRERFKLPPETGVTHDLDRYYSVGVTGAEFAGNPETLVERVEDFVKEAREFHDDAIVGLVDFDGRVALRAPREDALECRIGVWKPREART